MLSMSLSSLLPTPQALWGYNEILPGTADRILRISEGQLEPEEHKLARKSVCSQIHAEIMMSLQGGYRPPSEARRNLACTRLISHRQVVGQGSPTFRKTSCTCLIAAMVTLLSASPGVAFPGPMAGQAVWPEPARGVGQLPTPGSLVQPLPTPEPTLPGARKLYRGAYCLDLAWPGL